MVREHEAERQQQPLLLLIDAGRRMAREVAGGSRLDEAVDAALLLGHVALASDDRVGLYAFAEGPLRRVPADRGRAQLQRLRPRALYDLEPVLREPRYAAIAADVRRLQARRSLIVFFTDAIEPALPRATGAAVENSSGEEEAAHVREVYPAPARAPATA